MEIQPSNWMVPADRREVDKYIALATRQLDETALDELWAAGHAMTTEQAMALAYVFNGVRGGSCQVAVREDALLYERASSALYVGPERYSARI